MNFAQEKLCSLKRTSSQNWTFVCSQVRLSEPLSELFAWDFT